MIPEPTGQRWEPATAHFTPAELAAFLDQLALLHPEACGHGQRRTQTSTLDPVQQPSSLFACVRLPSREPPTVVDSGHLLALGALRARARAAEPHERGPLRKRGPATVEHPHWRRCARPWRRAFLFVALFSVALLLLLSLRALTDVPKVARMRRSPLLPVPSSAFVARRPLDGAATAEPVPAPDSPTPAEATLSSLVPPSSDEIAAARAPGQLAVRLAASSRPRPAARREAVDLLLSGRSRAALDAYRALLASWPRTAQTDAVEHVIRLLEREQASCARKPGPSCGT